MYFEIDGTTYHVKFHRVDNMTFANLYKVEEDGSLTDTSIEGVSICHPNDQFKKNMGRKVALAELLEKFGMVLRTVAGLNLDKNARAYIWEIYFITYKK